MSRKKCLLIVVMLSLQFIFLACNDGKKTNKPADSKSKNSKVESASAAEPTEADIAKAIQWLKTGNSDEILQAARIITKTDNKPAWQALKNAAVDEKRIRLVIKNGSSANILPRWICYPKLSMLLNMIVCSESKLRNEALKYIKFKGRLNSRFIANIINSALLESLSNAINAGKLQADDVAYLIKQKILPDLSITGNGKFVLSFSLKKQLIKYPEFIRNFRNRSDVLTFWVENVGVKKIRSHPKMIVEFLLANYHWNPKGSYSSVYSPLFPENDNFDAYIMALRKLSKALKPVKFHDKLKKRLASKIKDLQDEKQILPQIMQACKNLNSSDDAVIIKATQKICKSKNANAWQKLTSILIDKLRASNLENLKASKKVYVTILKSMATGDPCLAMRSYGFLSNFNLWNDFSAPKQEFICKLILSNISQLKGFDQANEFWIVSNLKNYPKNYYPWIAITLCSSPSETFSDSAMKFSRKPWPFLIRRNHYFALKRFLYFCTKNHYSDLDLLKYLTADSLPAGVWIESTSLPAFYPQDGKVKRYADLIESFVKNPGNAKLTEQQKQKLTKIVANLRKAKPGIKSKISK